MEIRLCKVSLDETVTFAAEELKKYLYLIDENITVSIFTYEKLSESHSDCIWLSVDTERAPKVKDARYDDAFSINIKDNAGYIAGTNPVSLLIGVYKLIKELGVKFIRPGREGEVIEKKTITSINCEISESASYRFRGINLDCTGTIETCVDFIDWLPKEGMNHYFFEYMKPYSKILSSYKELEEIDAIAAFKTVTEEAKKRGLKRHGVGHGWHLLALGFTETEKASNTTIDKLTPEQIDCLALRDGKRSVYIDHNLFGTQLCYSKKHLRDRMNEEIVKYLKANPEVDYLHFWLADGLNNHCECEDCKKHRPSDWYVMILNDLDRRLKEENITSRIVCLIYVDLLWEPKEFKIENPDRFILMFAPITRTYDTSYTDINDPNAKKMDYERNKLIWPRTASENALYLKDWREHQLKGDSFIFDYHLMWNQYKEPGYRNLSRVIYEDMKNLENLGLGGSVSCEVFTCQFPHDFPHRIMARTLWNKNVDYDAEEKKCFEEHYGEDYEKVFEYFDGVSSAFKIIYDYYKDAEGTKEAQISLYEKAVALSEKIKPVIAENLEKDLPRAVRISWKMLSLHSDYIVPFAKAYCEKYQGRGDEAKTALDEFDAVCERINEDFRKYFSRYFSKFSVRYYCDEITDHGPNVVLI